MMAKKRPPKPPRKAEPAIVEGGSDRVLWNDLLGADDQVPKTTLEELLRTVRASG